MKKKTIKILIIIFTIIIIIGVCNVVNGENEYSCDVQITPDKTEIKKGESVIYEIKIINIHAGKGIIGFQSSIVFDEKDFDCVLMENTTNEWESSGMVENLFMVTRKNLEPISEDVVVAKIKLTAKQDSTIGDKIISFSGMEVAVDGENNLSKIELPINEQNIIIKDTNIIQNIKKEESDASIILQTIIITAIVLMIIIIIILFAFAKKNKII